MAGCCGSWQLSRCGKSTATIWLSINFTCLLKWLSGIRWGDIWSMDNYYDYFTTFFFFICSSWRYRWWNHHHDSSFRVPQEGDLVMKAVTRSVSLNDPFTSEARYRSVTRIWF
jgi:hypothetical protein